MALTDPEDGILFQTPDGEWLVDLSMPVYRHHKRIFFLYNSSLLGNWSLETKENAIKGH